MGWWYIGRFGLAWMIGAFLFAAFWRRLGTFTAAEFYELRFSGKMAGVVRGWVSFRSTFISIVAWTGAGLLGMTKIAGPVLGFDKITTLVLTIPVALIYLFMSGYLGVVVTDVLQSILILAGSLVLMVAVLIDFGGPVIFLMIKFIFLPQAGYWYQALAGMGLTTALWIGVAFLTPPEKDKVLADFYHLARPMGLWNPVKDKISSTQGHANIPGR